MIATPKSSEPHIGAKTQTHAQSITPVSFRTIKTIVKSPKKPIPPLDDELLLLILTSRFPYAAFV
jgi:hypothetical protein